MKKLLLLLGVFITGLVIGFVSRCTPAPTTNLITKIEFDTVYVDSPILLQEVADLRRENLTLKEKIQGTTILKGDGPVVVYNTPVELDTALAAVVVKNQRATITLQAPVINDTVVTAARLIQLPPVNLTNCRNYSIGGNGTVRCERNRFGDVDLFIGGSLYPAIQFQPGLVWYKNNLSVPVYYSNKRVTIGVYYRF